MIRKKKNIGHFRRLAEVQSQASTSDGMGGQTVDWVTDFAMWMKIHPVSGRQKLELEGIKSNISHVIHCRAERDITNENRIVFDGRIFNVHYVIDLHEDGQFYEIGAYEG